jgi:diacylglycerol kinase family enzyme
MMNAETASVAARPRLQTIAAVVNPAARGVGPGTEAALEALMADYGYRFRQFVIGETDAEQTVDAALASAPDLLVVLAGDGTARLAAERCGPDGPLLAPLPGGTLNMLPHALYGLAPWPQALRSVLDHGVERVVGGGRLDGRAFFVAAVLGAPALLGEAREALRGHRLGEAMRRLGLGMRRVLTGRIHYAVDGAPERRSKALVLICPIVSRALQQETQLELAAFDLSHTGEILRLALTGFGGDWRGDPAVTIGLAERGWVRKRGSMPAMLDGETLRLPHRVDFEFTPRAFRALAPPDVAVASL